MEGLNYVGKLINKRTKNYKTKEGQEGKEYNIKLATMGASLIVRTTENVFNKLEEGVSYSIPVGYRTFIYGANEIGISWFVRTGEIINSETGEVLDLNK